MSTIKSFRSFLIDILIWILTLVIFVNATAWIDKQNWFTVDRKNQPTPVSAPCQQIVQPIQYSISMSCDMDYDINHLVPEAKAKAVRLVSLAKAQGLSVKIYETQRGLCRQTKLMKDGHSPRLDSKHLMGEAFDVVFLRDGVKSWDADNDWNALGQIGKSIGLNWGGDFKSKDPGHFELPPLQPAI